MDILLKCALGAIVAAVLGLLIKKNSPEIALLLACAAAAAVLTAVFFAAGDLMDMLRGLVDMTGLSEGIVSVVLKTAAAAVITGFASNICKDAGQSALASACETAGAMIVLYTALPLFEIVLETMEKLM